MPRASSVCALLLALPLIGRAADRSAPSETVIRLQVQPAPAPKPALRYQLLPELLEMNPGNPIQGYLRCFPEQNHFFFTKEAVESRTRYQTMPLKDLPVKKLRDYGGSALRQADYAARLDTPDWQILPRLKTDGIGLLIPDVQQLRILASALQVRFRVAVAERRFEDALGTAKTLFALARHLGEHPTLIGDLVGIAIAFVAISPLEEMLQQPGCPNLFWALTDLPRPLIDLRKGLQGERVAAASELRLILEGQPMTDAQLRQAVERLDLLLQGDPDAPKRKGGVRGWLAARAGDGNRVAAARKRLVDMGLPGDRVKQFPTLQVILLDEKLAYRVRQDEAMKAMLLPYWQGLAVASRSKALTDDARESLIGWLVPAVYQIRQAQVRLDQRIALLRCVEALRLYAAGHQGQLPPQLARVPLPLPVDPVTGKPFHYRLANGTATLRGTPPPGQEKVAAYNLRYEVTIRQ
jgi:hypothetical protein